MLSLCIWFLFERYIQLHWIDNFTYSVCISVDTNACILAMQGTNTCMPVLFCSGNHGNHSCWHLTNQPRPTMFQGQGLLLYMKLLLLSLFYRRRVCCLGGNVTPSGPQTWAEAEPELNLRQPDGTPRPRLQLRKTNKCRCRMTRPTHSDYHFLAVFHHLH